METVKYGFGVLTNGPMATPDSIATMSRCGEEMGFDFLSVSDHVIIPARVGTPYPYSETGEYAGAAVGSYLEQLATLSFVAGQTSTLRLLSAVLVLPHRSPVLTAKILATIDVLSMGRLIVGCGVGWMREEFEPIGAPPFDERGAVGDEYIRAFKELWTSDDPSFEGKYCRFSDITFLPKPVQRPHPPIWIGGESPPALRRAARLGDAWYPIGDNPRFPVGTAQQIAESFARVRRHVQDAGRDPEDVRLAFSCSYKTEKPDGQRRVFTGAPEQVAGDIWAFEQGGVSYLHLNFQTDSLAQTPERMERFAGEVRPLVEA
jgi:probable F420-dependent oxidoreductase